MNIILCGYKSCGKSTLARAYSQSFACKFLDTDQLIIEKFQSNYGQQCTIGTIYTKMGELAFRGLEANIISSMGKVKNTIIATGGGTVVNEENVEYLRSLGKIIYLRVDGSKLYDQLLKADDQPSFIDENKKEIDLKNYLLSRDTIYKCVSDGMIDTDGKTIEEIISIIHQYSCHRGQ